MHPSTVPWIHATNNFLKNRKKEYFLLVGSSSHCLNRIFIIVFPLSDVFLFYARVTNDSSRRGNNPLARRQHTLSDGVDDQNKQRIRCCFDFSSSDVTCCFSLSRNRVTRASFAWRVFVQRLMESGGRTGFSILERKERNLQIQIKRMAWVFFSCRLLFSFFFKGGFKKRRSISWLWNIILELNKQ